MSYGLFAYEVLWLLKEKVKSRVVESSDSGVP